MPIEDPDRRSRTRATSDKGAREVQVFGWPRRGFVRLGDEGTSGFPSLPPI